jgi:hypothetical protein
MIAFVSGAKRRLSDNPFYVLGLGPEAGAVEVERQAQKLLGMLELDLAGARAYQTPLGACERDAEKVRHAAAELRDPARRLVHELWARLPPDAVVELGDPDAFTEDRRAFTAPWSEAMVALGWSNE